MGIGESTGKVERINSPWDLQVTICREKRNTNLQDFLFISLMQVPFENKACHPMSLSLSREAPLVYRLKDDTKDENKNKP